MRRVRLILRCKIDQDEQQQVNYHYKEGGYVGHEKLRVCVLLKDMKEVEICQNYSRCCEKGNHHEAKEVKTKPFDKVKASV